MSAYVYSLRKKSVAVQNAEMPVFVSDYAYKPSYSYYEGQERTIARTESFAEKAHAWVRESYEVPAEGWMISMGNDHGDPVFRFKNLPTTYYDEVEREMVGVLIKSKEGRKVVWNIGTEAEYENSLK